MVAETLFSLWIGWSRFGLATDSHALGTFSFLTLLDFCVFSVVSVRERGWFWATMPGKSFMASLAAGAMAGTVLTFVGLPGLTPLPWWQTIAIFAYAMVSCLVVNDALKVAMIKWRVPNAVAKKAEAKADSKPNAKIQTKSEIEAEPKTESKTASKSEAKEEPQLDAKPKAPSDLTPQIAKRAFELYEQQGSHAGHAVQDWDQAEREIRKDEADAESQPETKANAKPETKPEPKTEPTPEVKPEAKAEVKPNAKTEARSEAKAVSKPEAKVEAKPAAKVEPPSDLTPQLVKRVHQLYEELGREEVRAVQELEQAEQEMHKDKPQK
jgi:hypothetical protein